MTRNEAAAMVDRLMDAIVAKENANSRGHRTAATLEFMNARADLVRALAAEPAAPSGVLSGRPTTSNADEWQLWLQDGLQAEPSTGIAFLAVQIVEAIEEHQRALAREVYALAENTAQRFGDLAMSEDGQGHWHRGAIAEAKSIARAINSIMPYSRDPAALKCRTGSGDGR